MKAMLVFGLETIQEENRGKGKNAFIPFKQGKSYIPPELVIKLLSVPDCLETVKL